MSINNRETKSFFVGNLNLLSGSLVVCDPLVFPYMKPFDLTFKPGKYPVVLNQVLDPYRDPNEEYFMNSFAMLSLSQKKPIRWEFIDSYPVDAGTSSFMDDTVSRDILDSIERSQKDEETLNWQIVESLEKGVQWTNLILNQYTEGNVIAFKSGLGDGFYDSYFGYDRDNNVAKVVTPFLADDFPEEEVMKR